MVGEKVLGIAEAIGEQSPQTASAHLRAPAGEPFHGPFGVNAPGRPNVRAEPEPLLNGGHFSKRNAGLDHTEGSWVHAEEHHPFGSLPVFLEVKPMDFPGVIERVVNVSDGRTKAQAT